MVTINQNVCSRDLTANPVVDGADDGGNRSGEDEDEEVVPNTSR